MLLVIGLLFPPVHACSCADAARVMYALPHYGDDNVPRNARYVLVLRVWSPALDSIIMYENGLPVPTHVEVVSLGLYNRVEVTPDRLLAVNSQVRVEWSGGVISEFIVGDQVDDSPPIFESIDVESHRESFSTCERIHSHRVIFNGLEGEYDSERVWTMLEPVNPEHRGVMMGPILGVMASEVCPTDDETLWNDFHRSYVLTVIDVAGNRSDPLEFKTRGKGRTIAADGRVLKTRGCSTVAEGGLATLSAGVLALILLRHRSRTRIEV